MTVGQSGMGQIFPSDATKVEIISFNLYDWIQTPEGIESFCQRLKVPNEYKSLALLFSNCLDEYIVTMFQIVLRIMMHFYLL